MNAQVPVFLAVLSLVAALLLMASVVKRYQAYKAQVRAAVKRHLGVIGTMEEILRGVETLAIDQEVRRLVRREIVERYRAVRSLVPNYPGIGGLLEQAETRLQAEPPAAGSGIGPIESTTRFQQYVEEIDLLAGWLRGAGARHMDAAQRAATLRHVGERRAEIYARFHMIAAKERSAAGDDVRAHQHLTALISALRQQGPNTDFVRELYNEAEAMLHPPVQSAPGPGEQQGEQSQAAAVKT